MQCEAFVPMTINRGTIAKETDRIIRDKREVADTRIQEIEQKLEKIVEETERIIRDKRKVASIEIEEIKQKLSAEIEEWGLIHDGVRRVLQSREPPTTFWDDLKEALKEGSLGIFVVLVSILLVMCGQAEYLKIFLGFCLVLSLIALCILRRLEPI